MAQNPNRNAPGLTGTQQPFGAVDIAAPCAPQPVAGKLAFLLPCGGTITSRASSPVQGAAQLVDSQGNPQGTAKPFTLAQKGDALSLSTPPSGQQWMVGDMSNAESNWIATAVVTTAVVGGGLAVFGAVSLIDDLVRRHKRKVARERFSRWFWGQ